jgi:peptide chain release factor 1
MLGKVKEIEERFGEIEKEIARPEVIRDQKAYQRYLKEHSNLAPIINAYRKYESIQQSIEGNRSLLEDPDAEIRKLAREEIEVLKADLDRTEQELKILLLPEDPNDHKNIILEIRKTEIMSEHATGIGGLKEIIVLISGDKVYSRLKRESGVHRVQRVPETEAQGRIHTSAVTVAVLPEAEEVDVVINPEELRIDVFRSSGPGGQHVNKTESAVRITHLPTGLVVTCQDEKSQHKNKAKAMKVLRSRLLDLQTKEQQDKITEERRSMVGSGDRSEKIRTYNFPQSRVTDHRIGLTLYRLDAVLQGNLDMILDPLITHFQAEALKAA